MFLPHNIFVTLSVKFRNSFAVVQTAQRSDGAALPTEIGHEQPVSPPNRVSVISTPTES